MRRREFVAGVGSAATWPFVARAQQRERVRRIGVLMYQAADDPEAQARNAAFLQGLQEAGWAIGRNMRIDVRWGGGEADRVRRHAAELVALAPDIILASGSSTLGPLQQVTRTVPIVFAAVADPVGGGFVESLARPGGNITGFELFEYSIGGKWLEHLKQIAQRVTRVAVLRDAALVSGGGQLGAIQLDQLNVLVGRDDKNNVAIKDLTLISPLIRLTGSGQITQVPGVPLMQQPLLVNLQLGAKDQLAADFRTLKLIEGNADKQGYAVLVEDVKLDGSLQSIGTSQLSGLINRALTN